MTRVLVTGAGGFIGHHLCEYLIARGYEVLGVDIVEPIAGVVPDWLEYTDCRHQLAVNRLVYDWKPEEIYALAADMGGAGYVFSGENDFQILLNNTLINLSTVMAARQSVVQRVLFTSSACVYPQHLQSEEVHGDLEEGDAYPAWPDSEYGWEKLYAEHLYSQLGDKVRIARFHNIYGPEGSWNDGREKLPAAACRKVAYAELTGNPEVEVWGDGKAVRSFCYIDDCLEMLYRLMRSDYTGPMNIGTDVAVTVDEVFYVVAKVAGIDISLKHVDGPQGVRHRNADLALMRQVLQYEPRICLEDGLAQTYNWVQGQAASLWAREQVANGAGY